MQLYKNYGRSNEKAKTNQAIGTMQDIICPKSWDMHTPYIQVNQCRIFLAPSPKNCR